MNATSENAHGDVLREAVSETSSLVSHLLLERARQEIFRAQVRRKHSHVLDNLNDVILLAPRQWVVRIVRDGNVGGEDGGLPEAFHSHPTFAARRRTAGAVVHDRVCLTVEVDEVTVREVEEDRVPLAHHARVPELGVRRDPNSARDAGGVARA